MTDVTSTRRRPRPLRVVVWSLLALLAVLIIGLVVIGESYHGPRDLKGVSLRMPGVPIFPYTSVAPRNRSAQRLLALPLLLMRARGVQAAETVTLLAPAERDFVRDWYRQIAPSQDWTLLRQDTVGRSTRLIFTRDHEVLQLLMGPTVNGLTTPVQLIYLRGVPARDISTIRAPASPPRR